jgi:general secretion pathway protein D
LRFGSVLRFVVTAAVGAGLLACSATNDGSRLLESKLESVEPGGDKEQRLARYLDQAGQDSKTQPIGLYQRGSGSFVQNGARQETSSLISDVDSDVASIQLNLVDVPVATAAKSVLGDALELNYSVDPRVQGALTLQTSKPVTKAALLQMFEGALRDIGASIVPSGDGYRVVPASEASRVVASIATDGDGRALPGIRPQIVTLNYVSASAIREIIEPLVPAGMILRADDMRNALILSGSSSEIATIKETIAVFDVDWMRGMSFALVPVASTQPAALVNDLEQIYQTKSGPLRGIVRFVPNTRLKSVLIISSKPKYLQEATKWIRKLDALAANNDQSLHVYKVQNRTAAELAKVLQSVLRSEQGSGRSAAAQAEVAPRLQPQETLVPADGSTGGPETPETGLGSSAETQSANSAEDVVTESVRIVSDDANNSLLIFATATEYDRILTVLQDIDSQPNQVLLEAVIAEVSLDDDLKFGVRWLIGENRERGTFSDLASGAAASSFPGFSYFLRANDISFTLNALASVTDVRVLSSPSLVVLDNKTAVLQVGDQVPIVTQSAQGTQSGTAPIVSNVELKDTGVILSVTPRVNDSGRVILDVAQEVSSVVRTTSSGIDSPTIRQRKIKTSVVVSDGQALALGGLIQERETTGKSKVPVLGDVPLIGNAFRSKTNAVARTELIIFIRPRVIRDMDEARRITQEFRKQLAIQAPRIRQGDPNPADELFRILQ